jgi:MraZ protein
MFRGQFFYSIDDKGRLAIPAKLRKQISPEAKDTFVMIKGFSRCIDLYPMDEWQKIEEKLLQLNLFNEQHTKFLRMLSSYASDDKMDSQARILIPRKLLDYAEIEKEVIILGALKKIEVWNPKNFEEYLNSSPETYEEIAAKVMVF